MEKSRDHKYRCGELVGGLLVLRAERLGSRALASEKEPGWIMRKVATGLAVVLMTMASIQVEAGIIITATEVGGNVIISGSGELDLTGAGSPFRATNPPSIAPAYGVVTVGPTINTLEDGYAIISGPASFGSGGITYTTGSGDGFGITQSVGLVNVPVGYVSGTHLSGTSTYFGASFASLGLTPGTYVYTIPSDSITFQVGPATVPEPSSIALTGIGLAVLLQYGRRRRRA